MDVTNSEGNTPLLVAIQYGYIDIAELILNKLSAKNINFQNKFGESALIVAIKQGRQGFAKKLIEHKINIHLTDLNGNTAMHHACILGKRNLIELLQQERCDIHIKNNDGLSPKQYAQMSGITL